MFCVKVKFARGENKKKHILTVSIVSDVTPSTTSLGAVGSSYGCWNAGLEL